MQMIPIPGSKNIEAVGYEGGVLHVQFKGGRTYAYAGVPQETYDALTRADSVGSYFFSNVRNAFEATRLPDATAEADDEEGGGS